jgi:hypothetical protein
MKESKQPPHLSLQSKTLDQLASRVAVFTSGFSALRADRTVSRKREMGLGSSIFH